MTETAHASGAAPDGERLLVQILGEARDDDGQLWALHRAIEAAVALPLDAHVIGEPLVIVAVEYDGNARRGLVAHCRREDGSEYRIGLADVEMPARTPAARHAAAYRLWLGIVPDAGAPAKTPRSRRQHKAGDDDLDLSRPVELVVLAVKERAARCRLLGGGRVITLRAGSLYGIVAGHIVTVAPNKHWRHAGHPYLSGQIAGTRIDARALGLARFLLASDEQQFCWPLAKDPCAHVHQTITHHELPVTHVTRRVGSPYVLVLTKTKTLFTREAAERKTWSSDLVWLTQTARSFGAPARPTRGLAIAAPADRVEARPRRGVRTRR